MAEWVVWVEAVNFDTTIYDTNDLATVRGGGLAALFVSDAVGQALKGVDLHAACIHAGASQCAFRLLGGEAEAATVTRVRDAVAARMRTKGADKDDAPHHHMMHVVTLAPIAAPAAAQDVEAALKVAEARARTAQFRQWAVAPIAFSPAARKADPLDRVRPATETAFLPDQPEDKVAISPSVKARRDYGRDARQKFYTRLLGKAASPKLQGETSALRFAQSFQNIVDDPPKEAGPSLRSKIAVVYADGNGFGDARAAVGVVEFGRQLGPLRDNLLKAICDWLVAGSENEAWADVFAARDARGRPALRFETILWGGDEMAFVMPAWLATAFVEGFFRLTAAWGVQAGKETKPLSHAVGVAIGHVKVPIRQLREIAKVAADGAKDAGLRNHNTVTFEIFESLHPPDTDLFRWRQAVFGTASRDDICRQWALPGESFGETLRRLDDIVGGDGGGGSPFPRSQLYAALRRLREAGCGVAETGADTIVRKALDAYATRAGADLGLDIKRLRLPTMTGLPRGEAMDLALVASLWDYANPFGRDFPRFSGGAQP